MQFFYQNNHSEDLIVFFAGWGCDQNQFTNLHDVKDILILYDYQDLSLDFDFSKYKHTDIIAYSAGVFVACIFAHRIKNIRRKVAVCGNPYLFDETFGVSENTIRVFQTITLDNYLDFRRKYMVFSDAEYEKYNKLESLRTIESCENEFAALVKMYEENKDNKIRLIFDKAIMAENDLIFNLEAQKAFYKDKLQVIKNARHHVFFRFNRFEDLLSGTENTQGG